MGKCRTGVYVDNIAALNMFVLCWGKGKDKPKCGHLTECLAENKDRLPKKKSKRSGNIQVSKV